MKKIVLLIPGIWDATLSCELKLSFEALLSTTFIGDTGENSAFAVWVHYICSQCGCIIQARCVGALHQLVVWVHYTCSLCGCIVPDRCVGALYLLAVWVHCTCSLCGCTTTARCVGALHLLDVWVHCTYSLCARITPARCVGALHLLAVWVHCTYSCVGALYLLEMYRVFASASADNPHCFNIRIHIRIRGCGW